MSRSTQVTCDECGQVKKETNNWWTVIKTTDGRVILSVLNVPPPDTSYVDLCGRECVQKYIEKWMSN